MYKEICHGTLQVHFFKDDMSPPFGRPDIQILCALRWMWVQSTRPSIALIRTMRFPYWFLAAFTHLIANFCKRCLCHGTSFWFQGSSSSNDVSTYLHHIALVEAVQWWYPTEEQSYNQTLQGGCILLVRLSASSNAQDQWTGIRAE